MRPRSDSLGFGMLLAVTGSALAAQPTLRGGIPGRMPRFETDQLSADDVGALVDGQVRLSQTGSADMELRTHFLGEGPGPGGPGGPGGPSAPMP